uniref:dynein axonemal intermediate chain 1-like n=1 Tax=Myxine glutinosa TaxID=7769 RepID=UPI00358F7B59
MNDTLREHEQQEGKEQDGEDVQKDESTDMKTIGSEQPDAQQDPRFINKFNYNERGSQTFDIPRQERATQLETALKADFCGTVNKWKIYEACKDEMRKNKNTKERGKAITSSSRDSKTPSSTFVQSDDLSNIKRAAKIIERVVNMNNSEEIAQDYRYFEDASDDFRGTAGTLLPLWSFYNEKVKNMAVTALCWNPHYEDLIVAGYGSFDSKRESDGILVLYSLKNQSFPEAMFPIESGVLSIDIHPTFAHLAVLGCYDGFPIVMSLENEPTSQYASKRGVHRDPVWQVKWQQNDMDDRLRFLSVSSDGQVVYWTMRKNAALIPVQVMQLTHDGSDVGLDAQYLSDRGTTIDFHREMADIFLVGTKEGMIYKCSTMYNTQYLESFSAHNMAVEVVRWNYFHPNVFISCSADYSIKIWDHTSRIPLFVFNLWVPIVDVVWAPYSSTVFAAATGDGKVLVFDLAVNKYEALCQQFVLTHKKSKLTHLVFSLSWPVIAVGDDRGYVTTFKLSPNLRRQPKASRAQLEITQGPKAVTEKMEKLLIFAKTTTPHSK